jgi:hypothetical protein
MKITKLIVMMTACGHFLSGCAETKYDIQGRWAYSDLVGDETVEMWFNQGKLLVYTPFSGQSSLKSYEIDGDSVLIYDLDGEVSSWPTSCTFSLTASELELVHIAGNITLAREGAMTSSIALDSLKYYDSILNAKYP